MSVLFWILLAIGLAVIEMVSVTFFPIFFTISAIAAAIVEIAGGDPLTQWLVFGFGGLALSGLLRPIAKRQLAKGPSLQSNVDRLAGRAGMVSTPIDGRAGTGAVTIDGEVWSAKPYGNDFAQIPAGVDVQIHEVRGATLIVAPIEPVSTTEVQ